VGREGGAAGALRRSEEGFTLIELLVAMTIGMVVLGGAVTVMIGALHSGPRTESQVTAVQEGRVAVERMTRELRQGLEVLDEPAPAGNQLALITYVKQSPCGGPPAATAIPCRVTYTCGAGACSRTVQDPSDSTTGTPVEVVNGLATTTNVFSYVLAESEPTYVGVQLTFTTQEGSGPVVVADGAALRNGGPS
jgi:prepilin-type N-terminal cleavage/methylation domain-containing protein